MAPRPDRPADEPADQQRPDDGEHPRDDGAAEPGGRAASGEGPVSDELWAAIVADLRADLDPTDPSGPDTAGAGDAGSPDGPRTTSGPAVTYPVAPWPGERRVVRPARRADQRGDQARGTDVPPELAPPVGPPRGARDWDATDQLDEAERRVDAAEHFRAPDPGPVLGGDPLLTMAWLAVGGLPLFWLVVVVAWRDAPRSLLLASAVVFGLGLALLLWRMPRDRDPSTDGDDGAVV
ncbi:MAG TPA: hypothetical protein VGC57_06395 [Cellulomonas sp.]